MMINCKKLLYAACTLGAGLALCYLWMSYAPPLFGREALPESEAVEARLWGAALVVVNAAICSLEKPPETFGI